MPANRQESQQISQRDDSDTRSEERSVTRAAGVVGFWTTLSRIFGFVRDMVIALFMGAGPAADAFFVAFRIPNLLRRLFGEGALSAAFIPTFVETLQNRGKKQAEDLARVTVTFAAITLAVVTLVGVVGSPWIVKLMAPGFSELPDKFQMTVDLNRIMFPYIFFISLVALGSGILNSMGYFAAPAAAPILLNLSMISSVAALCSIFGMAPEKALSWGVVTAGLLQLLLLLPFLNKAGMRLRPSFRFRDPALKRIGILFIPAAFGGAVYQLNVLVGTILASLLPSGSVSWLYYADRLVELPLGVFAIALGTAVLPSMSRLAAGQDIDGLKQSLSYALRLIAFFTIPASFGLILLREPIVAILFQRGLFTYVDTQETAYALLWYTTGLWAFSGLKVVTQTFFSMKDTRTPVWVAMIAVAVNLIGGLALMGPLRQGGLALATSIAAAFNLSILFFILTRRLGGFPFRRFALSLVRITAASSLMGAFLIWSRELGQWNVGLTMHNAIVLALAILGGLLAFLGAARLLRSPELASIAELLGRRRRGAAEKQ